MTGDLECDRLDCTKPAVSSMGSQWLCGEHFESLMAPIRARDAGICVVKVKTDGSKMPMSVPGWGQLDKATGDRITVTLTQGPSDETSTQ